MTEERLVLAELLEKAGEGDFLRAVAEAVLQLLMESDVEGLIGAGRYERSGERTTWRNGYRDRTLDTRLGALQLRIPKLRQSLPSRKRGQLLPAVSRSPQELGEGAGRGDPGGLDRRRIDPAAMVFQSYALYPHMTVYKNIAFPLRMAGSEPAAIDRKVRAAAQTLNLTEYLNHKPGQLSGGQRQRVAIGRAIVREPKAFLFDEPLSNLDAALRVNMRLEITELHQSLKTTMIYVTHDQVEAMTMADRIVVLRAGNVEQVGSPLDLYRAPRNLFVAGFIGSPQMNLIHGVEAEKRGAKTIGVRPEHVRASHDAGDWGGTVSIAEHLGSDTILHVPVEGIGMIKARVEGEFALRHGQKAYLTPDPTKIHRFDADGRKMS